MTRSWMVVAMAAVAIACSGCSLLTPGLDTRQAAEANSSTVWDKDSNLWLKESTTHNRRITTVESAREEGATVEYYPDGTAKSITGASQILTQNSEPKDAMGAYMHLATKNAEVAADITRMLSQMIPVITQAYVAVKGPPAPTPEPASSTPAEIVPPE